MITVGSLFSGIGGMDLGLERAGMQVKWQVEIDPYCRKVLAKHWPSIKRCEDVREVGSHNLDPVDLICGGFPCQDISNAGKRAGIEGKQSGLWSEFYRIICELRPRYVLVENVRALLVRGMDRVLGDLADGGYDAEWDCIPAAAVGAPHLRYRIFVIANSSRRCFNNPIFRQANIACRGNGREWFKVEPDVDRVADGVPRRVDRLRGLGNAVVPQVAEWIGRRIVQASERCERR